MSLPLCAPPQPFHPTLLSIYIFATSTHVPNLHTQHFSHLTITLEPKLIVKLINQILPVNAFKLARV